MQADITETGQGVTGEAILLANPEGWVLVFRVESIQSFLQPFPNFLNFKTKNKDSILNYLQLVVSWPLLMVSFLAQSAHIIFHI